MVRLGLTADVAACLRNYLNAPPDNEFFAPIGFDGIERRAGRFVAGDGDRRKDVIEP